MTASMYPLKWPEGWARTPRTKRREARYRLSVDRAVDEVHEALRKLGALNGTIVLSSNVPPKNGLGTPRNDGTRVEDPGVAVWWATRTHGERVIACDKWNNVRDNVRAVGLALEALRSIERAGASQILERAFTSFGQLPMSEQAEPPRSWWEVFEFPFAAIDALSPAVIDARYRELARKIHPDVDGGSEEAMKELNAAREAAKEHVLAKH